MKFRNSFGMWLMLGVTLLGTAQGLLYQPTKYDRANDTTTAECDLLAEDETPHRLSLQAFASYRGKEPNETTRFWLTFFKAHRNATRKTPPQLQSETTLTIQSGKENLEFPITGYQKEYYELIRHLRETARVEISPADMQKLAAAQQLKGKWGEVEFTLDQPGLAKLKGFIARHVPASSTN